MNAMKILLGALVALIAIGGIAMATPTTTVNAAITTSFEVSAPSDVASWNLGIGGNSLAVSGLQMHTNYQPWGINVFTPVIGSDDYHGAFYNFGASKAMTNPLHVNAVILSDASQRLDTEFTTGDIAVPLTLSQDVTSSDPVGTYKTVIEFDGTF